LAFLTKDLSIQVEILALMDRGKSLSVAQIFTIQIATSAAPINPSSFLLVVLGASTTRVPAFVVGTIASFDLKHLLLT